MALQEATGQTQSITQRSREEYEARMRASDALQRHYRTPETTTAMVARAIGWFGLGLGLFGLMSPRTFARLTGLEIGRRRLSRTARMKSRFAATTTTVTGAMVLGLLGARRRLGTSTGVIDVERSLTIRRSPQELYDAIREPKTLQHMMGHFADVRATTPSRLRWTVPGPREPLEWETQIAHDHPGELIQWESLAGAQIRSDISIRFRPAPRDWGTETTLRLRIDPGSGALRSVARFFGRVPSLLLSKALHRFKSLVETGEVPTTDRQPAARNGGRDT